MTVRYCLMAERAEWRHYADSLPYGELQDFLRGGKLDCKADDKWIKLLIERTKNQFTLSPPHKGEVTFGQTNGDHTDSF